MSEDIQAHWRVSFDPLRAALHNQPSRLTSVAAFCFTYDPHGSLKSPACSCVSITLPASSSPDRIIGEEHEGPPPCNGGGRGVAPPDSRRVVARSFYLTRTHREGHPKKQSWR